jgi:hypothetical protein
MKRTGRTTSGCGEARKLMIKRTERMTGKAMKGKGIKIEHRVRYRAGAAKRFEHVPQIL